MITITWFFFCTIFQHFPVPKDHHWLRYLYSLHTVHFIIFSYNSGNVYHWAAKSRDFLVSFLRQSLPEFASGIPENHVPFPHSRNWPLFFPILGAITSFPWNPSKLYSKTANSHWSLNDCDGMLTPLWIHYFWY